MTETDIVQICGGAAVLFCLWIFLAYQGLKAVAAMSDKKDGR